MKLHSHLLNAAGCSLVAGKPDGSIQSVKTRSVLKGESVLGLYPEELLSGSCADVQSVALDPLPKQHLKKMILPLFPSQQEHDLASLHVIVSTGLNLFENHF